MLVLFLIPTLMTCAFAATSTAAAENGPNIIKLPMRRVEPPLGQLSYSRRPNYIESVVPFNGTKPFPANTTSQLSATFYTVGIQIGQPPQTIQVNFDTGSSETWVNPYCNGYADYEPSVEQLCRGFGIYLPEQSETVVDMNGTYIPRAITYGSGAVLVRYYKDDVAFSENFTISQAMFGAAEWSFNMPTGIMGAAMGQGYNQDYPSFIDNMYNEGLIEDKDFSVALGSVNEDQGEVVFGGVDTRKFTGSLHGIPMSSQLATQEDLYFRYWVNLSSISITEPGFCDPSPITNSSSEPLRVLLDTGTTLTYLPHALINRILDFFPGYLNGWEGYEVGCHYLDEPGSVNFGFNEIAISVPYKDFIYQSPPLEEYNYTSKCYLGVYPGFGDFYVLGDTFLRSAYVVFRQQAETIFIAQAANCGSNVISSHGDLEGLDGDCEPPLTGYGSPSTCSSTSALTSTPVQTPSARGNSTRLTTVSHTSKHHSTTTEPPAVRPIPTLTVPSDESSSAPSTCDTSGDDWPSATSDYSSAIASSESDYWPGDESTTDALSDMPTPTPISSGWTDASSQTSEYWSELDPSTETPHDALRFKVKPTPPGLAPRY